MHPFPPSSIHLHPAHFNLHPAPPSSLQHPQQYLNQNIAHNLAISPNLGKKLKVVHIDWKLAHMVYWRCWFWIQTSIFEIVTPKSIFGQIWAPKIQSCPFCLKIGTHHISKMLILIATLMFWISNPNFLFGQILTKKVKVVCFL